MSSAPPDDELLKPREAAAWCRVSVQRLRHWVEAGKLPAAITTPGGHRRYRWADIRAFVADRDALDPEQEQLEIDATRLYDQGWSIRQVAEKFDCSYGAMRRILRRRTVLRLKSGKAPDTEV